MPFEARYEGSCNSCGYSFGPGAIIRNEGGLYVHMVCPPPPKICPTCFLAVPVSGVCEDCD